MDRNSNTYTFIYAAAMVILVAAILASAAMALRPRQDKNVENEKMQNILASVNIESTFETAGEIYADKIRNQYVINSKGEIIEGEDAFEIDLKREKAKPVEERLLPVFECQTESGLKYIFPMRGAGLWGPVWGFVSLNDDMNTIYGANFDHQSETPGLGAEISTDWFQEEFKGKQIFDSSGNLVSITVTKPGQDAPEEHSVDGISGGTITSKGLEQMLLEDFNSYEDFLMKKK
ncbi:MAG: NADH:ubiquinone reductase (Na(+)-transporting) subunit C [Mariniphaga sp.]|jgi:Na+-transporting NADH:ubiquinone oxidoreductase subunit C|nr:NADH:ubiquinone reductase (Na(+)-transporting) subunit C [Mariniphaga sp.]